MKLNYKRVFLAVLIIIVLVCGIGYSVTHLLNNDSSSSNVKNNTTATNTNKSKNKYDQLSYYHEDYLKRYQAYEKDHSNLSVEDIVTHVNMGIDKKFFSDGAIRQQTKPDDITTIVNKVYKLDDDWSPNDLVLIKNTGNLHQDQQVRKVAATAFEKLREHCKAKGITLHAHSGYRSTEYQTRIFNNMVKNYGEEYTDTVVSRPGHSEHTTGLCIDVALDNIEYDKSDTHPQYRWFVDQLADYGFIVRYPKGKEKLTGYSYESWHIRYLGVDLAKKVQESSLTYDEYYARNF